HKYSLLDEKDVHLVKKFRFEAKVDVNKDGNGANIFAYAFDLSREGTSGCYFHEYIWERHCGGIAPGFRVCHKNGVTVDNRLNNLCVVPSPQSKDSKVKSSSADSAGHSNNCGSEPREDQRLYWMAVCRLPPFEAEHEHFMNLNYKCYNANGEQVLEEDDTLSFYECHYPPCCKMETELREFSICGQCQQVRYCGPLCQERDWPSHKKYCKEKARQRINCDMFPER
ncbi:zinc finger MYND domain-containing protein 19-like, partial [Pocillopora damicornis]